MKVRLKKITMVILAFAMAFAFVSCSGGETPPAEDPAAAENDVSSEQESTSSAPDVEPLTVTLSTTYNQTEAYGQIVQYFIDKLAEVSGGQITVNATWGGTLFDSAGELEAVMNGAVNIVPLGHMPHTGTLNYLGFPSFAPGGVQNALDYYKNLIFENPETSALITEEAESLGIKYLNALAGGGNAICSTFSFSNLESLVKDSSAFANMSPAMWENLGFHVVPLPPPDIYDAFSRGLCDTAGLGLSGISTLSWYEVAPYNALDGTYAAGNMLTVNLEWWNGLSEGQQTLIQQAATETEAFSVTTATEGLEAEKANVEEATGEKFIEFSEEDLAKIWAACFDANAEAALKSAEEKGKTDGMNTILQEAARFTGYEWKG